MGRPSKVELCLKIVEIALKDSFSASPPSSSFHTPAPGKSRPNAAKSIAFLGEALTSLVKSSRLPPNLVEILTTLFNHLKSYLNSSTSPPPSPDKLSLQSLILGIVESVVSKILSHESLFSGIGQAALSASLDGIDRLLTFKVVDKEVIGPILFRSLFHLVERKALARTIRSTAVDQIVALLGQSIANKQHLSTANNQSSLLNPLAKSLATVSDVSLQSAIIEILFRVFPKSEVARNDWCRRVFHGTAKVENAFVKIRTELFDTDTRALLNDFNASNDGVKSFPVTFRLQTLTYNTHTLTSSTSPTCTPSSSLSSAETTDQQGWLDFAPDGLSVEFWTLQNSSAQFRTLYPDISHFDIAPTRDGLLILSFALTHPIPDLETLYADNHAPSLPLALALGIPTNPGEMKDQMDRLVSLLEARIQRAAPRLGPKCSMPSIDISTLPGIVDVGPLSDIMSFSDDSDATAVDILNGDAISGDNEFEHVKIAHGENAKDDEILDPKPKSKAPYRIPLTKLSSQILPIATIRSASKKVPKEVMTPRTAPPTPTPRLTQPAQTPGIKNLRKEDELLNGAEIDDDMDFDLTTRSDTDSEYNDESQRARIRSLVAEKAEKASAKKVKKLFGAENDREKPANTKETKEPTTKPTRKSKPKANPKPAVIESAVLDDEIHGGDEDLRLSDRMTNRSNETPAPAPKATQVSSSKIAAAVAETKDMDPIVPIDSRRKTVPQTSAKKVVDKLHKRRKVAPHLEPRSRYTKYPEYVDDKLENGIRIENQHALNLHQDLDATHSDHIPDSLFPQSSTHSSDDSYSGKAFSQKLLQAVGKSKLQASKKRNLIELGKRLGLGAVDEPFTTRSMSPTYSPNRAIPGSAQRRNKTQAPHPLAHGFRTTGQNLRIPDSTTSRKKPRQRNVSEDWNQVSENAAPPSRFGRLEMDETSEDDDNDDGVDNKYIEDHTHPTLTRTSASIPTPHATQAPSAEASLIAHSFAQIGELLNASLQSTATTLTATSNSLSAATTSSIHTFITSQIDSRARFGASLKRSYSEFFESAGKAVDEWGLGLRGFNEISERCKEIQKQFSQAVDDMFDPTPLPDEIVDEDDGRTHHYRRHRNNDEFGNDNDEVKDDEYDKRALKLFLEKPSSKKASNQSIRRSLGANTLARPTKKRKTV